MVDGRRVEVWEDPAFRFGATAAHMRVYAEQGDWVLLFNAMMLASAASQA
jgi:hypothetical protein